MTQRLQRLVACWRRCSRLAREIAAVLLVKTALLVWLVNVLAPERTVATPKDVQVTNHLLGAPNNEGRDHGHRR